MKLTPAEEKIIEFLNNNLDKEFKAKTIEELKVETEGHFGGLGIVITLDENKVLTVVSPIEDTPAFKAGILAGDKIVEIEAKAGKRYRLNGNLERI